MAYKVLLNAQKEGAFTLSLLCFLLQQEPSLWLWKSSAEAKEIGKIRDLILQFLDIREREKRAIKECNGVILGNIGTKQKTIEEHGEIVAKMFGSKSKCKKKDEREITS